ncbi:hypothetical protein ACFLYT_00205 [Nanoarchaeota archaeon]
MKNKNLNIRKEDVWVLIGCIVAFISKYKFPLFLGTIAIICGIIAKYKKSKYWVAAVVLGVAAILLYVVDLF